LHDSFFEPFFSLPLLEPGVSLFIFGMNQIQYKKLESGGG
jgi:hypothetical protein